MSSLSSDSLHDDIWVGRQETPDPLLYKAS